MQMLQLLMAVPASLGFALFFNMRGAAMAWAALGGLLSWGVFLLAGMVLPGVVAPCFAASVAAALYAELLAAWFRAPSSIFFIVGVIPLIPGRYLFDAMQAAVAADWTRFWDLASVTGQYALAIALGISVVWAIGEVVRSLRGKKPRPGESAGGHSSAPKPE